MAMTKKERAQHDAAIKAARVAGALRWTSEVKPDIDIPTTVAHLARGWLFNTHNARVAPACSSTVHHSFGRNDRTETQGPRCLYSTKVLALQAMRHELEREFAQRLAYVDEQIDSARMEEESNDAGRV